MKKYNTKLFNLLMPFCLLSSVPTSAVPIQEISSESSIKDEYGESPLFEAIASWADEKKAKELILQGENVNFIRKIDNTTPLFWAAKHGLVKTVELLINHGASINFKTDTGDTPLLIAAKKGYEEIVKLLVKKGADVNIANENGENALSVAKAYKHNGIVDFFESLILN